ncbi:serine carboxypeptidase-like 19 [Zingiber officinale]|uniref:serine carboxypeptidase-like 19 n=1 Tax=Zingiber officinale TaxID=94328 RepID=UPI001C4BF3AF|nr:serine carboxypeptidase-like 19 [Zingiber officinale]
MSFFQYFFSDVYGHMPIMGIGSGTIIDPDGTILTCAHCIADFSSRQVILKGKVANIIFVDSPLGSGFSYSRKYEGYDANDTIWSEQASKFLLQWLVEHPQFISNPLYIAGDSYAGKIVPMVAKRILDGIDEGKEPLLNLQVNCLN